MNTPIFALLLGAVGASAIAADHAAMTPRQAKALDKALAGKVPGKPETCVQIGLGSDSLRTISDSVVIYRINKNLTYRNDLIGQCNGISRGNALVLQPTTGRYCRGDIARSYDTSIGMIQGGCALGDFVPYRTPGTGVARR